MLYALALAEAGDVASLAALEADRRGDIEAGTDRWGLSQMLWAFAYATWLADERSDALAKLRTAFTVNLPFDRVGTALKAATMGWVAASSGDHARACVLLGAADAIWSDLGTSMAAFGSAFGEHTARCRERLERALAPADLERLLAVGARMDYDALLAYATDADAPADEAEDAPVHRLTRREREVAQLLADGLSNRQIAARLVVSPRTVEGHVARVIAKLGFASRTQVATWFTLAGADRPMAGHRP
jgi:DNA-binding NarL/FixJ family response regulator